MKQPTLSVYLIPCKDVVAINPKHQGKVKKLAEAYRKIDFHADTAMWASDQGREQPQQFVSLKKRHSRLKTFQSMERRSLGQEEKWFDKSVDLEEQLPDREIRNALDMLYRAVDELNGLAEFAREVMVRSR